MDKYKELLGYKLVFGIAGPEADSEAVSLFRDTGARGLILYRRNYRSPEQVRRLVSDMENALGRRLLVCVDHEGGRVIMFGGGVTVFPDNYAFGLAADAALPRLHGEIEAAELRALGVDVNFAPVVDVLTETYNPGILSRSYSRSADKAARLAAERIRGMQSGGISATAKHYPGKGHAVADAHIKLPVIDSTLEEMEASHLKPFFAAIEAGVDCVMSSHPLYRKIDPDNIATFSKKIVTDLLRRKYGFNGVIVSDDLEMGAVSEVAPVEEAIVRADMAGHDVLLVCHAGAAQRRAYAALAKAYDDGVLKINRLEASVERIKKLHAKRAGRFGPSSSRFEEGAGLAALVADKAAAILQRGQAALPADAAALAAAGNTLFVYPRFSDISSTVMIEREMEEFPRYFADRVKGGGLLAKNAIAVGINPTEQEIAGIRGKMRDCGLVVAFIWDAGLLPGWQAVLEEAQSAGRKSIIVLLRDMFDIRFAKPGASVATGYGFRKCQIDAVLAKIFAP